MHHLLVDYRNLLKEFEYLHLRKLNYRPKLFCRLLHLEIHVAYFPLYFPRKNIGYHLQVQLESANVVNLAVTTKLLLFGQNMENE